MQVSAYAVSAPLSAAALTSGSTPTAPSETQTAAASATSSAGAVTLAPASSPLATGTLVALLQTGTDGTINAAQDATGDSLSAPDVNPSASIASVPGADSSGLSASTPVAAAVDPLEVIKEIHEGLLKNAPSLPGLEFVPTKSRLTALISDLTVQIAKTRVSMAAVRDSEMASALGRDYQIAQSQLAAYKRALPNAPDAPGGYVFSGEAGAWSELDPSTVNTDQLQDPTAVAMIQQEMQAVARAAQAGQNLAAVTGTSVTGWAAEYNKLESWVKKYQKLLNTQSTASANSAVA